ncbi:MAG: rane fusion protein multidrug efflux system [Acidobacteriota bacterium]|jgi:membrane fusion protein (multidrug efflux system)|nr:rane fusion protein multidrug efflux system [Acidobacteriota bacterium]
MADKKIDLSGNTRTKVASVVEEKSTTQTASTLKNVESASGTTPKLASTDNSPANDTPAIDPNAKRRISFQKLIPLVVLLLAAGILFGITGGWNRFVGGGSTQRTDDAFLRADITPLSTRVSGTVAQVAVTDYQRVKAGDLLVQLKDDDFKAQVAQSEAGVAGAQAALENNAKQKELQTSRITQAEAGVEAASAEIAQTGAAIEAAKADVANAQAGVDAAQEKIPDAQAAIEAAQADAQRTLLERKRQEALVDLGSATKQRLEQVVADQERFAAILKSRQAELAQIRALVASRRAELSKARAQVSLREAEQQRTRAQSLSRTAEVDAQVKQRSVLDTQEQQLRADLSAKQEALKVAQTNLEYTRIVAPTDGIVGERKVRIGQLVSPGTQVISLVENTIWVQANYKETQLTNVAKGDAAEITVDAFPGVVLRGHVEEIAPASGSQFALLPPDNASGNYTKIVQRIPVKIALDLAPAIAERLRPGMSVIAEIKTTAKSKV